MSWTKKNVHPGKIVSTSQEVEVMVLDVDPREAPHQPRPQAVPGQSVGCLPARRIRSASTVEGEIKQHHRVRPVRRPVAARSTAWSISPTSTGRRPARRRCKDYNKGDIVKAKVLDVDIEKERISLGIKQLADDPFAEARPATQEGRQRSPARSRQMHDERHRGDGRRRLPASSARPSCPRPRPSSGPTASPSARRSMPR